MKKLFRYKINGIVKTQAIVESPNKEEAYKSSRLNLREKVVVVAPTGHAIAIRTIVLIIGEAFTNVNNNNIIIGIIILWIIKI